MNPYVLKPPTKTLSTSIVFFARYQILPQDPFRMLYTSMNVHHDQTVIIRGKPYRYDPDFDAYYAVQETESTMSKYAWIPVCIVLAIAAYCIENFMGPV